MPVEGAALPQDWPLDPVSERRRRDLLARIGSPGGAFACALGVSAEEQSARRSLSESISDSMSSSWCRAPRTQIRSIANTIGDSDNSLSPSPAAILVAPATPSSSASNSARRVGVTSSVLSSVKNRASLRLVSTATFSGSRGTIWRMAAAAAGARVGFSAPRRSIVSKRFCIKLILGSARSSGGDAAIPASIAPEASQLHDFVQKRRNTSPSKGLRSSASPCSSFTQTYPTGPISRLMWRPRRVR